MLPACIDDYIAPDTLVCVVDAFVASRDLADLGFGRTIAEPRAVPDPRHRRVAEF
jgi:hypothetical protein